MKYFLSILFALILTPSFGQQEDYETLLNSAKDLYKSVDPTDMGDFNNFNYNSVISLLESALELNPKSAEARYFLGYTYSRMNAMDARGMIAMNLDLLYKTSEQFEKVIELSPKYSGEMILLDPYSKISSEWGSMAMSYLYYNKPDSAVWAFKEGKRRGGFNKFMLEFNRSVLDECSKNAILITFGDNITFPLWYLQTVEKYRTDVSIVDANILDTKWYPEYLSNNKIVKFDVPDHVRDTIKFILWEDADVNIKNFYWTLKPSIYGKYILRRDRLMLSMLKNNQFRRDVYFTSGFPKESMLSLNDFVYTNIMVDKLKVDKFEMASYKEYKQKITAYLMLTEYVDTNKSDEVLLMEHIRYNILSKVDEYMNMAEIQPARELFDLLNKYIKEEKFPYANNILKEYVDLLKAQL